MSTHASHAGLGAPDAARGSPPARDIFAQLSAASPELKRILATAFVTSRWGFFARRARASQHCRIVERLGRPFDVAPGEYVDLLQLTMIAPGIRLMVDQPRWLLRDGLLAVSLWEGDQRMFSLSFTLGDGDDGLTAYVGGIQGRHGADSLERYRALTKAAHGLRPRDLLIDLFRLACRQTGVKCIWAVSNGTRFQQSFYYRYVKRADEVTLDYDAIWTDRGAVLRPDGWFDVPLDVQVRDPSEVSPKKRGMYRARR